MVETNRVWKFSTIGLLAVLAVGFSFPQAFAHATNNVGHMFQHVLDALGLVQTDVNAIKQQLNEVADSVDEDQIVVVTMSARALVHDDEDSGLGFITRIPEEVEGTLFQTNCTFFETEPAGHSTLNAIWLDYDDPTKTDELICNFVDQFELSPGDRIMYECIVHDPHPDLHCTIEVTLWMKLRNT